MLKKIYHLKKEIICIKLNRLIKTNISLVKWIYSKDCIIVQVKMVDNCKPRTLKIFMASLNYQIFVVSTLGKISSTKCVQ